MERGKLPIPNTLLEKKIIIIGGGISGLTCAEKLVKRNFTNVKILESSDRAGGRLYSYKCTRNLGDTGWCYLEMGAQRVHGSTSMYKLAENSNQINPAAPNYPEALENLGLVYDKNECSAISILKSYFSSLPYFPEDFDDIKNDPEFTKLFERSDKVIIKYLTDYMKGVYHWWLYGMAYEYTFRKKQAELYYGYSGILQSIIKNLPDNTILQNKEVVKIDSSDFHNANNPDNQPKIKVYCKDGSLYETDHVIVTIPLGCLKENCETLFSPPLCEDKVEAIQSLNFITVNKIFLEFENPFWETPHVYHVIWNEKLDRVFDKHKHGSQDPREWLKFINRFEYVHTYPKILGAWIWGEGAVCMENVPDEDISCCCKLLLESLLKKPLPQPVRVVRSKWFSNPYSRGSLLYNPSKPSHHYLKKMGESICVKGELLIQFAGDATEENQLLSTAHGARQSGIRAARELIVHCAAQAGIFLEDHGFDSD